MKKLIKPASLILYILAFIFFFFAGMLYVSWSGAAEGQGLAGGAIVFMNGLLFGFLALVASLFLAYYADRKIIIRANQILLVMSLLLGLFLMMKHRDRAAIESSHLEEFGSNDVMWSMVGGAGVSIIQNEKVGLVFF